MTFRNFQEVNARRTKEVPSFNCKWPMAIWALAICGEAGELANILKKVERGDFTLETARPEILKEIADVLSYAISAMEAMGADAGQELAKKFDEVSSRVNWNGTRLYWPENDAPAKRPSLWARFKVMVLDWWRYQRPVLPCRYFDKNDPDCSLCGEFGPCPSRRGCKLRPWLRLLSMFRNRVIVPDCPEGKRARPLLTRWFILHTKPFSIFVHRFHRSDLDEFHDHPWNFWTFLLSSGYWEHIPNIPINAKGGSVWNTAYRVWRPRFSLLRRPALYQHYVEIPKPLWTIVFKTKTFREWGFIVRGKWIQWNKVEAAKSRSICED